jgi:acyl-CoA thioesterase II
VRIDEVDFLTLLTLEPHGPDTFVGIAPAYPWGERLFGGQVIAQALRAAAETVDDRRPVHSLHAYFIRPGTHREPVRFEVDRIRNGRSFFTRRVVARQSNGAILNLSASFQVPEGEADVETVPLPADLPDPESLVDEGWGAMLDRRPMPSRWGWAGSWIRLRDEVGEDPVLQSCALAFISDAAPTGAARAAHPDATGTRAQDHDIFMGASLDHLVWFHRPSRAEDWHWFDVDSHGLVGGRGLTVGNVISAGGTHVATIAQEVLLRRRRPS